jgi:hypothetical protein
MPKSFVSYRGHGFWSRDSFVEDWLARLVQEIDALPVPPDWLREAREYWNIRATVHFNGCIDCRFDEIVSDPERWKVIIDLATRISAREGLTRGEETTADLFISLLRDELSTTPESPKNYMARD